MKRSKRPRIKKNRERDYYQIPKGCEKEIQRSCEFVTKLKEFGDKKIFIEFLDAMKSYQLKSLTYIDLKTKVFFILRDHEVLLQDFKQLLLDLATEKEKNQNPKKSDVGRTVEFLNKLEALGNGVHGAFLNKLVCADDIPTLVSQLDWILRDHTSLKQEFRTFLIDYGLLKEYEYVTPSYMMRHEAEEVSSSSSVLNGTYVSVGHESGSNEVTRIQASQEKAMNDTEDKLFKEDMYYKTLKSVVKFGKGLNNYEKPPVGFNEVVRRFYKDCDKKVPRGFKTEPKLALQGILPTLQIKLNETRLARRVRRIKIIRKHQQKNNVNK